LAAKYSLSDRSYIMRAANNANLLADSYIRHVLLHAAVLKPTWRRGLLERPQICQLLYPSRPTNCNSIFSRLNLCINVASLSHAPFLPCVLAFKWVTRGNRLKRTRPACSAPIQSAAGAGGGMSASALGRLVVGGGVTNWGRYRGRRWQRLAIIGFAGARNQPSYRSNR